MAFIIENYLDINTERAATEYYEIYEVENFNTFTAGASLLSKEIKSILWENEGAMHTVIQILEEELKLEVESPLMNQIIETHKKFKIRYNCGSIEQSSARTKTIINGNKEIRIIIAHYGLVVMN